MEFEILDVEEGLIVPRISFYNLRVFDKYTVFQQNQIGGEQESKA